MRSMRAGRTSLLALTAATAFALVACGERDRQEQDVSDAGRNAVPNAMQSRGDSSAGATGSSEAAGAAAERAIDDSVITTKAKTALLGDNRVKGSEIHVETNRGVVVLTGTVENQAQIDEATRLVRRIDGVKNVEVDLKVQK